MKKKHKRDDFSINKEDIQDIYSRFIRFIKLPLNLKEECWEWTGYKRQNAAIHNFKSWKHI